MKWKKIGIAVLILIAAILVFCWAAFALIFAFGAFHSVIGAIIVFGPLLIGFLIGIYEKLPDDI